MLEYVSEWQAVLTLSVLSRIDQNTDDIEMNVMGAQRELLKYYTSISSNRWLIAKIFVTIVLFFLLFTFIM